jgi:hypothetical protein
MTWVEERQGPSRAARSRARARAPARARCVGRVGSPSDTATVTIVGQSVGHRPPERDDLSPRRGRRVGCRSSRRSACVHSRGSTPRISRRSRLPSLGSHHSSVWRPLRLCAFAPLRRVLRVVFSGHRKRCRWPLAFTASGTGTATATAAGPRSEDRITLRGGDISTRKLGRYDMGGGATGSLASSAFPSPSPCPSPMCWAGGLAPGHGHGRRSKCRSSAAGER